MEDRDFNPISFPPLYIPTFNNPTYLTNMLNQLSQMKWENVTILDGGSTYAPMINLLDKLSEKMQVISLPENPGPRYFSLDREFLSTLPQFFCVSDPDIQFNKMLPANFISVMIELSERYQYGKVGFALDIGEKLSLKESAYILHGKTSTIREYEKQFWANRLVVLPDSSPVFIAPIDTTFALYNKKFFIPQDSFDRALRVAGNYSSLHIPWLNNDMLPAEERKFYALRNMAGAYHELDGLHLRLFSDYQDILSSFSWKITKPVRLIARFTRSSVQLFRSLIKWKS
jgi:glycosyltransferase involved in cell wall biosynthesis